MSLPRLNSLLVILLGALLCATSTTWAKTAGSHIIDLEWEKVDFASQYEVELTRIEKDGDRQDPQRHKTKQTLWRPLVSPGNYEVRIRTFDERGVPGPWSPPSPLQVTLASPQTTSPRPNTKITSKDEDSHSLDISWKAVAGAKNYKIEIKSVDGSFKDNWDTDELKKTVSLPVGKDYLYRLKAISEDEIQSPDEEWQKFSLYGPRLKTPKPVKPLTKIVDKVSWEKSPKAENYRYDLLRKLKGKKWTYVKKNQKVEKTEVPFDLKNPSGTYMLRVTATAKNRSPSKRGKMIFKIRGGFRSPAAAQEAVLQESMKKPTNFYGIASYFVTQADYTGLNKESGVNAAFSGLTGTGRIGLGYQHPDYIWGVFGIADMGGILVNGENKTFTSVEAHGTVKFFLFGANQFLFSGGPYMIELPEVTGDIDGNLTSFNKITNIGLHGGFKYWRPINSKYGLQANARLYLPVTGSSPTGEAIETLMSYQFGLLGSYRWSETLLLLAGYAYRINQAGYAAQTFDDTGSGFAEAGDVNSIQMKGHYLNMMIEYSF